MAIPSDEILVAASARGDEEAFRRLASRYGEVLDGYFRRRLPDDGRAEELRQETLMAIYALLPSYRERGRFRSLVFSIAYRKLASSRRAEKPREALAESIAARDTPSDAFETRAAISRLPDGLREALLLTVFEGLRASEAGAVLGCSAEAVRARVCRAKAVLGRFLNRPRRNP
ncbi:MAG: RNA polymerase sigma factor [Acidobacteriota bacterium]